jgi:hypothetical protein
MRGDEVPAPRQQRHTELAFRVQNEKLICYGLKVNGHLH